MSAFIDFQNDIENNTELQAAAIAVQSDLYRRALTDPLEAMLATQKGISGRVVTTQGVAGEGGAFVQAAILAISAANDFTEENDPHGEHDFGEVTVMGQRLFWKLDLYDTDYAYGSNRPYSPEDTRRVLTIMQPSEY